MTEEEAIKLLEEDRESYIKASECGLGYPSDNREHREKAKAIAIVLAHLKFYKEGLEREIDKNRENVLEIIQKDRAIEHKTKIIDEIEEKLIKENIEARKLKQIVFEKDNIENDSMNLIYSDRYMKNLGYELGISKAVEILNNILRKVEEV